MRLSGAERASRYVFAAITLTFWALLPAYSVAVLGLVTRRRWLALAAAPLIVLHLVWVWRDLPWAGGSPAADGVALRVAAANVLAHHTNPDDMAAHMRAIDTDVFVVTELTPPNAAALERQGIRDRLPHAHVTTRDGFFGAGIYTRFPIRRTAMVALGGRDSPVVTLDVDGTDVTIVAVHTLQPLASLTSLRNELAELPGITERLHGQVILAGDFNATWQHSAFRAMLRRAGLRDSHQAAGRGLAASWPNDHRYPPFALLDHVLVPSGAHVDSAREFDVPGSDHKGVVAAVVLPRRG